jgi:1-acyl-sn-glycerol-3-phosphate acyltransferase
LQACWLRVDWRSFDPSWARRPLAIACREAIITKILGPLIAHYTHPTVSGLEVLDGTKPPVVFAANHSSHLDTPTILRALPKEWRRRTATIAAADYFYKNRIVANLVTLSFGTVPIERSGGMSKLTADRLKRLTADGWSMLIYPEGTRSRSGEVGKLRSGAAYLAVEHRLPMIPIYVQGTSAAMPVGRAWPRSHPVRVTFGDAVYPIPGDDHRSLTARLQEALTNLSRTTPPNT